MSAETEAVLLDWQNNDRDTADDLHRHFTDFGRWDWCDIYREATRLYNLMFVEDGDTPVENLSPLAGIWAATAAQAASGAFEAVAAALGVDGKALEHAVADWYESQDAPPPSVGAIGLMDRVAEAQQWLADLKSGKFDKEDSALTQPGDSNV